MAAHWDNPTLLQELRDRKPAKEETILEVLLRIEHEALNLYEFAEAGGMGVSYEELLANEFHKELKKLES